MIIDKIGKRNAIILGNSINCIYLLLLCSCSSVWQLIFAQLFCAIGFNLKGVAEPSLLNASITDKEKRGEIFSKIDGTGLSRYYYLSAISAVASGFLFAINGYIPFTICICIIAFSVALYFRFKEIKIEETEVKKENEWEKARTYFKDLKSGFSFIFKSRRLKGLILFAGVTWGAMCMLDTYEVSLLKDIGVSAQAIGIIFAALNIISGIASKKQAQFHEKHTNHTLGYIAMGFSISCLLAGLCVVLKIPFAIAAVIIISTYAVRYADLGLYVVSIKRYLGNFSTPELQTKIFTAHSVSENVFRMTISLFGSMLLTVMNTAYALTIAGCVFTLLLLWVLRYMKPRVGLNPEEYSKQDIEYREAK